MRHAAQDGGFGWGVSSRAAKWANLGLSFPWHLGAMAHATRSGKEGRPCFYLFLRHSRTCGPGPTHARSLFKPLWGAGGDEICTAGIENDCQPIDGHFEVQCAGITDGGRPKVHRPVRSLSDGQSLL